MSGADRTPMPQAPTRRGALTRAKLIEAGRKAFSAYGYEIARVADIVRLAGVSHGNFYRHFVDKDDLLHAVLDELHQGLRRPTRVRASAGSGMLGELIAYNASFFHQYAEHRHMLRVSREAAAKPEPNAFLATWLEMRVPYIERNRRWMKRLQDTGSIDRDVDVALLAEALGSMSEQLAYVRIGLAKSQPTPEEIDELGRICGIIWFRSLFGGATAEPDAQGGSAEL